MLKISKHPAWIRTNSISKNTFALEGIFANPRTF